LLYYLHIARDHWPAGCRSEEGVLELQLLHEVEGGGRDAGGLLRLGRRLLLVQRFHRVGEGVFLVFPAVGGVQRLQRGLLQLGRALLHLQQRLVLSGAHAALDFLLQVHDLSLAVPELPLQSLVHSHYLLVVLLQLSILAFLFPQFFVIEALLGDFCLHMG
jgi:hypothetical protein